MNALSCVEAISDIGKDETMGATAKTVNNVFRRYEAAIVINLLAMSLLVQKNLCLSPGLDDTDARYSLNTSYMHINS